ncbi:hypothetical protein E2C01_046599 [Portunus trituberculatus]|uniref:Uncharacterized protein n=1 Tax=Portunus trituberculatus TaxID=210409 RepID=A0A5B7G664_PORTR|nr:hypothetical protein [Portunus trituberculatus]
MGSDEGQETGFADDFDPFHDDPDEPDEVDSSLSAPPEERQHFLQSEFSVCHCAEPVLLEPVLDNSGEGGVAVFLIHSHGSEAVITLVACALLLHKIAVNPFTTGMHFYLEF